VEVADGGKVTWYPGKGKQGPYFPATCGVHRRCTRRRSAAEGRQAAQGRPLGHLVGRSCSWAGDPAAHHAYEPALEARQLARREVLPRSAGADVLADKERPRRAGDDDEPEELA
jgi:hypothetical protein